MPDWVAPAAFTVVCGLLGLVRQLDVARIAALEREVAHLRAARHKHATKLTQHSYRLHALDRLDDQEDPNGA